MRNKKYVKVASSEIQINTFWRKLESKMQIRFLIRKRLYLNTFVLH